MANIGFVLLISAISIQSSHQIRYGRDATPGEMPFHAAILHIIGDSPEYACGGTVISDRFVLTVEYCTYEGNATSPLPPKRITVWLGILNLQMPDPTSLQTHNVKQIHVVEDENEEKDEMFSDGIALLELLSTIRFTKYVQPASLDVLGDLKGQLGTIAGWGLTEADEFPMTLKIVELPKSPGDDLDCLFHSVFYSNFSSRNKVCAGYDNGTGVCNADNGGGLVFRISNKWFVDSIYSTSPTREDFKCEIYSYGYYFEILHYLPWIRWITGLDSIPKFTIPVCGVRSRYTVNYLITAGQTAKAKEWPWHAAIFHVESPNPPEYACGASLIHRKFVLTVRHCTLDFKDEQLPNDAILVRMGIQQLNVGMIGVQERSIVGIYTVNHTNFTGLKNDIALLELKQPVIFTDFVFPICLPKQDVMPEELGAVVGFGFTEEFRISKRLKTASMPVVEDFRCLRDDFGWSVMDEGLFCAGHANGTAICSGDSGGGLVFPRDGTWELGGLVSFTLVDSANLNRCRRDTFGAFTRVYKYLPWIASVLETKGNSTKTYPVMSLVRPRSRLIFARNDE